MTRPDTSIPQENGSRKRGMVLVLTVFILGLVCGAAFTIIGIRSTAPRRFPGSPEGRPAEMRRGMERMADELSLDEAQRRAIREIFDQSRREIHEITRESRDRIREVLDEEQREKFDRLRERRGPPMRGRRPGRGGRERPPGGTDLPPPPPEGDD